MAKLFGKGKKKTGAHTSREYSAAAQSSVHRLFNDQFKEELKNRGRLQFDKVVQENAAALETVLNQAVGELDNQTKGAVSGQLQSDFTSFATALQNSQNASIKALEQVTQAVEAQEKQITETFEQKIHEHQDKVIAAIDAQLAQIVEHYLTEALGSGFSLKAQMPFIMEQMEANKAQMLEDMKL